METNSRTNELNKMAFAGQDLKAYSPNVATMEEVEKTKEEWDKKFSTPKQCEHGRWISKNYKECGC